MGRLHATSVDWRGRGVLLTGPSGSGKSDIALRLVGLGATLVADDQVLVWASGGALYAKSPETIAGLMEVRAVGITHMPFRRFSRICLIAELNLESEVERLPLGQTTEIEGISVERLILPGLDPSTPLKVMAALKKAS